jgi:uncharacterized membrane protein YkgB
MPRSRHHHPTSRASVAGAVLGIFCIAVGIVVLVPVAMKWPDTWPGLLVTPVLIFLGARLIARHKARHRSEKT